MDMSYNDINRTYTPYGLYVSRSDNSSTMKLDLDSYNADLFREDGTSNNGWNGSTINGLNDYLGAIGSLGNIAKIYYFGAAAGTEVSFAFPNNSYNKIWVIYTTHGATPTVNTLWIIHPNHVSGNCFRLAIAGGTTTGVTVALSNPNTANCRLKVKSTGGTAGVYGLTYGII